MGALSVVWSILSTLLLIYFFVMWARFVLDLVRTLEPEFATAKIDLDKTFDGRFVAKVPQ